MTNFEGLAVPGGSFAQILKCFGKLHHARPGATSASPLRPNCDFHTPATTDMQTTWDISHRDHSRTTSAEWDLTRLPGLTGDIHGVPFAFSSRVGSYAWFYHLRCALLTISLTDVVVFASIR
jgi:hypothetical protein